jgi:hypothetical protein
VARPDPSGGRSRRAGCPWLIQGNTAPTRLRDRDAPIAFSWRDGDPVVAATDVRSRIHVGLKGNGFRVVVPADRTIRTFTLYFGLFKGRAACGASLSDGSAVPVIDSSFRTFGRPEVGYNSTGTVVYEASWADNSSSWS